MKFKEFIDKIIKLKQENPEIAPCIAENYYLKSIYDKDNNFSPCLFFYLNRKDNYKLDSVYDLTNYMDKEVKEIKYDNGFEKNIVYIDSELDKLYND